MRLMHDRPLTQYMATVSVPLLEVNSYGCAPGYSAPLALRSDRTSRTLTHAMAGALPTLIVCLVSLSHSLLAPPSGARGVHTSADIPGPLRCDRR